MGQNTLAGFYSRDPVAARAALERLASPEEPASRRIVTNTDVPYTAEVPAAPDGLWSEAFFGLPDARGPDAWAVVELPAPVFHRAVAGLVGERLGLRDVEVVAIAERRAWLEAGKAKFPPGHPGVGSALEIDLDDWPPDPGYGTEEVWRREEPVGPEVQWESWLAEWRRARGIDTDALERALREEDDWHERAKAATGVEALVAALGSTDLFAVRVPVPPVTERPLEPRRGGYFGAGATSRSLAELVWLAGRVRQLIELEAPEAILLSERRWIQASFDALLDQLVGDVRRSPRRDPVLAEAPREAPDWPVPEEDNELTSVLGVAFTNGSRALVDFATATFEIELATGAVTSDFRSGHLHLLAVSGTRAVYTWPATWQFSVRELDRGEWNVGPLRDTIPFGFDEAAERAYVTDLATGLVHPLWELGQYPTRLVIAPTGDVFHAMDKEGLGGVFRQDGDLEARLERGGCGDSILVLLPEGRLVEMSEEEVEELDAEAPDELAAFAFSEAQQRWRHVAEGAFHDGPHLRFRFGGRVEAAAFDVAGENLVVAMAGKLLWVELDPDVRVRATYDLGPLRALFLGPESTEREVPTTALHAVLFRHGTLADLAGASVDADTLAGLNTAMLHYDPEPLGRENAARVLALARGAVLPARLPSV